MDIKKNKTNPENVEIAATLAREFISPAVENCYRQVVANNEKNPLASLIWFALGAFLTHKKFSTR